MLWPLDSIASHHADSELNRAIALLLVIQQPRSPALSRDHLHLAVPGDGTARVSLLSILSVLLLSVLSGALTLHSAHQGRIPLISAPRASEAGLSHSF